MKPMHSYSPLFSCVKQFPVCLRLENQVLERFEQESDPELLKATVCLIEESQHGLLETELLEILADSDKLLPPRKGAEKGETCRICLCDLMFMSVNKMDCSVFC